MSIISIIEPVGGHGGMNYYIEGLCRGLSRANSKPLLFTCDETEFNDDIPFQVFFTYNKIYGKGSKILKGIRFVFGTIKSLYISRKKGSKVVHYHFFAVSILEAINIILAKLFQIRIFATVHDIESFVTKNTNSIYESIVYHLVDGLIVHNNYCKKELINSFPYVSKKITIIPHGNYTTFANYRISKSEARSILNLPASSKTILFFGQIKEVKGLDILIKAFYHLSLNYNNVILLIAGRPWKTSFSKYQKLINDLGINKKCSLHIKYIPDGEVETFFAASDLVALPYRRIYQSGVLLKAMSYRIPVIVSNLPGMTEIIKDNTTGFIFETEDESSLFSRLEDVLFNECLLRDVAARGFNYITEKHNWLDIAYHTKSFISNTLIK